MDPKKNKPKTGSQPMNVDPNTAARMSNLPAGGRKNIRVRKLSDEEKAQSRQSKIKGGLENLMGRSFGGGEPTAGGDVDPKTGNLLPKDPRRPKKNRNVGGPAGPGDIDPETGDLIGEGAPEPSSGNPTGNPYKFKGIADLKKKLADINARGKEQERLKGLRNDPLRSLNLPAQGTKSRMIQPEDKNESVLHERSIPFTQFPKTRAAPSPMDPELKRELEATEARRRALIPQRDAMAKKYGMDTSGIDARKAKEFNPDGTLNPSYTPPPPSTSLPRGTSGMGSNRAFSPERLGNARARAADRDTQRTAAAETKRRSILTTPGRGLSPEQAAANKAGLARSDAADANLKRLEAGRKTMPERMATLKTERDALEAPGGPIDREVTARAMKTAMSGVGGGNTPAEVGLARMRLGVTPALTPELRKQMKSTPAGGASPSRRGLGLGGSRSGGELQATSARRLGEGVENHLQEVYPAAVTKPNNTNIMPKVRSNMPMMTPEFSARMLDRRVRSFERATGTKASDTLRDKLGRAALGRAMPGKPKPAGDFTLLGRRTNELQASSARRLGEGVKKAGHPESFELGLDAETTDNPEYQKILRQKRVERAKQMLNPKLARTMGDDVSQDDIEAADRAARRRKRVDEAMGNEDSEYQRILQSMRANDPVLRMLRGAKPAGDGMVSVKPIGLSKAEDKKLERAYLRKFNPRNVGKDAY